MRDCPNTRMRDLLPDLLHDRLPNEVRVEVRAHVEACDACRFEVALLQRVRAAVPERRPDAARIVAALPSYQARTWWRRSTPSTSLRIAAAIVLLAGGAIVIRTLARPVGREPVVGAVHQQQLSSPVARGPDASAAVGATASIAANDRTATLAQSGLETGETLQDLSDAELRALLDELGDLDAMTPTEDDVVPPSLGRGGS